MGFGFITPATILTLALVDMGRSAVSASLLSAVLSLGILGPQIFSAFLLSPKFTHPKPLAWLHSLILLGVLSAGIGFLVIPPEVTVARLVLLFSGIAIFALGIGLVEPHWIASMGRCIPQRVRGRFFGSLVFISSLCATFSGWLASHWVAHNGPTGGYAYCFLSAFVCMVSSVILLAYMEPLGPAPHRPPTGALKNGFKLLNQKLSQSGPFRGGIILTMLLYLGCFPAALLTVYLREQVKLDASWFEIYTPALTLGMMAGALLLGLLLDHRGLKSAFTLAFLVGLSVPLLAFQGQHPLVSLGGYLCAGFFTIGYTLISPVLILRISHHKESSVQAGLFNSLMIPFSLSALGYGFVASHWGYGAAFGTGIVFCVTALLILTRIGSLNPEPKNQRRAQRR